MGSLQFVQILVDAGHRLVDAVADVRHEGVDEALDLGRGRERGLDIRVQEETQGVEDLEVERVADDHFQLAVYVTSYHILDLIQYILEFVIDEGFELTAGM